MLPSPQGAATQNQLVMMEVPTKLLRLEAAMETVGKAVSHIEHAVSSFPAGVELIMQSQLERFMLNLQEELSHTIALKVLAIISSNQEHMLSKNGLDDFVPSDKFQGGFAVKLSDSPSSIPASSIPKGSSASDHKEIDFTATQSAPIVPPVRMTLADSHRDLPDIELEEDSSLMGIFWNDTDVGKPKHKVEYYYSKTGIFQAIARSDRFAVLTIFVVLLNAVYLAVDSDWNRATNIYSADLPFLIATQFFCSYFVLEIIIRYLAFENKNDCMYDGWFKLDLFLAFTMVVDVWVIMVVLKVFEEAATFVQLAQPVRMLRLFKLIRMVRIMHVFPELMIMIKSLIQSLRASVSSMFLLLFLIYSWSILLHLLLREKRTFNKDIHDAFGYSFQSIGDCMWSLWLAGTLLLDDAAPLMTRMMWSNELEIWSAGILFVMFTFISSLVLLQMLIGVLCDVVARTNEERRNATCIDLVKQELMGYLLSLCEGGDGMISKHEISPMFEQVNVLALFRKFNINKIFFQKLCNMTFHDEDSQVPIRTILEVMLMCRGDNPVNVNIIASALCLLMNSIGDVLVAMSKLEFRAQVKED